MAGAIDQADMVAAFARAMPESYLAPMQATGDGFELVQGIAAVGVRCSLAVSRLDDDIYIITSAGPSLATVTVTFSRPTDAAGAGTVKAGTLVRASTGGQVFKTIADAVFGSTDLQQTAAALSAGYGYEYNVLGEFTDPHGEVWPGQIDTIDLPIMDPPFFDPTIVVGNVGPATGGRPGTLDQLGAERNLPRQVSEPDTNYKIRIRQLPDVVAPNAIQRQLKNYFRPYPSIFWYAVETTQHEYQECFDAPLVPPVGPYENYNENLFCFDDPRPPSPIANRWLGEQDYSGAFIVEVGQPQCIQDYGFAYDDTAITITDLESELGLRSFPAYDIDFALAPPGLACCYDGIDFGVVTLFTNLFALLDQIKGGGVYQVVVLQEVTGGAVV